MPPILTLGMSWISWWLDLYGIGTHLPGGVDVVAEAGRGGGSVASCGKVLVIGSARWVLTYHTARWGCRKRASW